MRSLPPSTICTAAFLLALAAGCGSGGQSEPPHGEVLRVFSLSVDGGRIRSGAACDADIEAIRTCIFVNNVPAPRFTLGPFAAGSFEAALFADRTGLAPATVYAAKGPAPADASADAFVQLADSQTFGIHLDTRSRGPAFLSNMNPLFQFERFPPAAGAPDTRLTPWTGPEAGNVEIAFSFDLRVKRLTASPGSHAYGHPTFDLWDRKSNVHFYFIVMAFGTVPSVDNVLRDDASGRAIVATAFRQSPYGRSLGAETMATPSPFVSALAQGTGGHFEFRFNLDEFRRIIAAARTLEPSLSDDPADYLLDDFHFNTEIAGDGEIGETLGAIEVRLLRR